MALVSGSWPLVLLPRQVDFHPDQPSRTGGPSLSGVEQITTSPAGRWRAKAAVAIRGESRNLALRAFVAQMEGRAGTVMVPKWERFRPRDVNGRQFSQMPGVGYDCEAFNADLSGYAQSDLTHATLAASAALGATQISVNLLDGEGPRPGHYFGIGERLYRCSAVWQAGEGDPTQIRFWPRLRASATSGTRVILDRPVCLMRFADDGTGEAALSRAGSGLVAFDFVEVV